MINSKFVEYRSSNSRTSWLSSDKQPAKKTSLKDLQNDNKIMVLNPPGNLPFLKDRGSFMEAATVSGTKRSATERSQRSICNQSLTNSASNGHLVYARRKLEQELIRKSNNCEKDRNTDCAKQDQQEQVTPQQQSQSESTMKSCLSAFTPVSGTSPMTTSSGLSLSLANPLNELSSGELHRSANASGVPYLDNSKGMNEQHWKNRFLQLQTHLRACDSSDHQEYIKGLQTLSPVGRSKHAVELEKRAIQLLLEEGHELARMRQLNVLGKSVPMNSVSPGLKQFETEK